MHWVRYMESSVSEPGLSLLASHLGNISETTYPASRGPSIFLDKKGLCSRGRDDRDWEPLFRSHQVPGSIRNGSTASKFGGLGTGQKWPAHNFTLLEKEALIFSKFFRLFDLFGYTKNGAVTTWANAPYLGLKLTYQSGKVELHIPVLIDIPGCTAT